MDEEEDFSDENDGEVQSNENIQHDTVNPVKGSFEVNIMLCVCICVCVCV